MAQDHALGAASARHAATGRAGALRHRAGRLLRRPPARARRRARRPAVRRPRARWLLRRRGHRAHARDPGRGGPRARSRAAALPDGRRHAARSGARHRRRRRHVRLRAPHAQRPQRAGLHPLRAGRHQERALARRSAPHRRTLRLCVLRRRLLARVSASPLRGGEILALRLLSLHNLHFYGEITSGARDAIARGEYATWASDLLSAMDAETASA